MNMSREEYNNYMKDVCIIEEDEDEEEKLDISFSKILTLPANKLLLSIDVGILNLGLSVIEYNDQFEFEKILGIELLNITDFYHPPTITTCKLNHSKSFADWMDHIFYYYNSIFSTVDMIIIERQPPTGLVAIEQLIFSKFRNKSELISPNSMHKHFNINYLTYDNRKLSTENISRKYLMSSEPIIYSQFENMERKHDISDSICQAIYWLDKKRKDYIIEQSKINLRKMKMVFRNSNMSLSEWIEQFRYTGVSTYNCL